MNSYQLLITDLDNTLYDWVTYYSLSFDCYVKKLNQITDIPLETLLDEFKLINQQYHDSEYPLAVLDLPSIKNKYGQDTAAKVIKQIKPALDEFYRTRNRTLKLYPGVCETLRELSKSGIKIVGHTEALYSNALYRLSDLRIMKYFDSLYAVKTTNDSYFQFNKVINHRPNFLHTISRLEKKPNPSLLLKICETAGIPAKKAIYIGDSLVKDMSMAKAAGITAVWAKYGTIFNKPNWDILVRITHWTDEDVEREAEIKEKNKNVEPDITCDRFSDLLVIMSK